MKTHSIKYNFIMKSTATVITILVPLIIYPYVSRILQPAGIGRVNFAQSVIYYFTVIAQLGIPTYGIRECAKVRDNKQELSKTAQEIFTINLITCLISYILLIMSILFVPQLREEKNLVLVMSASTLLQVIGVEWLYSGLEMYDWLTLLSLVFKILMVVGVFLLVKKESDAIWYGAMLVVGTSGFGIVNFLSLRRIINTKIVGKLNLRKHLKPILVFFSMSVAVTVYTQMDSVMLGFMKGTLENGYYDAAVKIKLVLVSFITSLGTVIMPRASYHLENGEEEIFRNLAKKAMNFVVMISLPFCLYFILFAQPTIMVLSGESFQNSVQPMKYIMPTIVMIGITNIVGLQVLVPLGREKGVLKAEVTGAIVNIAVNAFLIPSMGASGAAIGTVAAEAAVLVVELIYAKDFLLVLFKDIKYFKIILALILATVCSIGTLHGQMTSIVILLSSALLFFGAYCVILLPEIKKIIQK